MNLGDYIKNYRERLGISQRDFARRCNVSNSYISFLERGCNPSTGERIVPSLDKLLLISRGMDISLNQLMQDVDDFPVSLSSARSDDSSSDGSSEPRTQEARIISGGIDKMPKERREQALRILQAAFSEYSDFFKEDHSDET